MEPGIKTRQIIYYTIGFNKFNYIYWCYFSIVYQNNCEAGRAFHINFHTVVFTDEKSEDVKVCSFQNKTSETH